MTMTPHGIHHLTAVSADIRQNVRFYTDVLGMRLVKRSVNQDQVSAYHLFYADGAGSPGTDLTFFDFEAPPERRGSRVITRTGLRVRDEETLRYWDERLRTHGVRTADPSERDGRAVLDFEDPEGQRLSLTVDDGAGDPPVPWGDAPVPEGRQIRGLGPIRATVPEAAPTETVLERVLGMRHLRSYEEDGREVRVHAMGDAAGPHAELHLDIAPDLPPARPGAGGVHHVAFRVPDHAYQDWADRLSRMNVPNSGPVDRFWFRSLYFREPNGILFELATDGPGFAVDEDVEHLGERVVLPPFLEPQRDRILAGLKPLD
ncbi:MAG: ring-cleaving dioxygenase [Trueperaceae bacterium]|nr:ring-cleaving dioxygenase [Trueperaceae bacterium]